MSVVLDTRAEALGDGSLTELQFDFLITKKADLLVTILESGQDPIITDGDDTDYVTDVEFDPVEGGGTVTLATALAAGKTLYLDLNVVEPSQPNIFRDRSIYSLRDFEKALDYVVTQVQTLFRNMQRSVRFARHIDLADFDPTLPDELVGQDEVTIVSAGGGTRWGVGPTVTQLTTWYNGSIAAQAAAEAARDAALVAKTAAETAETNAETAETNAETAETNAETAATNAAASAAAAAASETAAETAETNAETAETNAETAATNAAASAAAASTSETNAAASEAAAAASATAAQTAETNAETAETNAETAETNAAASAAAAAISAAAAAAAAGAAAPTVTGSRSAPTAVVGANGVVLASTSYETTKYIQGSGGAVTLTANPRIGAGSIDTQKLRLVGCSDVNTITMGDGNGVDTASTTYTLKNGSILDLMWDNTTAVWIVVNHNGV